ncbi:MAG TPA: hypothetical protein VJK02_08180 [Anaerolineales bacterium]|nr:hypothetical protein [Anaerolineales bacterium]
MVHALERVHGLLQPVGVLVDIHPSPEPPVIQVRLAGEIHNAGWLRETDDYVEYEEADRALAQALDRGLYALERQTRFSFTTHAPTLGDLQQHLEAEWKDAFIEETTVRSIEDLLRTRERDKEVLLRESVQISRLRPVAR